MKEGKKDSGEPDGFMLNCQIMAQISSVYRVFAHHALFTSKGSGGRIIEMFPYKWQADEYLEEHPDAVIREVETGDVDTWTDGIKRRHHHRMTFMDNVEVP